MDQVVKLVAQKTGLSEDKAKVAVETVIEFLKDKLPEPVAGQIDSVMSLGGGAFNSAGSAGGIVGGLLGRKG
jgi:hypothetical protein